MFLEYEKKSFEDTFDNSFIVIGGEGGGSTPVPSDVTLCYDTAEMDALTSAFKICDLYCVTIDEVNYDDWDLPSRDEAVVVEVLKRDKVS